MIPRGVSVPVCLWLSFLWTESSGSWGACLEDSAPLPTSQPMRQGPTLCSPTQHAPPVGDAGTAFHPSHSPDDGGRRRVSDGPPPPPADPESFSLARELESILAATGNRRGKWSALAVSLDWGDTLLALRHREPLVPASNTKLFTTAAALLLLGPDFRLPTFLLGEGSQVGEVLEGNLVLFGTGDPTLDLTPLTPSRALGELAAALVEKGIARIRGDIVVDGSFFGGPEFHPDWDPHDALEAFAPPVTSMMVGESLFTLQIHPGAEEGAPVTLTTFPRLTGVPFVLEARTGPPETPAHLVMSRDLGQGSLVLQGELPSGGRPLWRRLPVSDPLLFAGLQLRARLEQLGVAVEGEVLPLRDRGSSPLALPYSTSKTLAKRESPPLFELLRVINKHSHNLYAEVVFRVLGRVVAGDGSFEGGSRVVRRFLVERVGIAPEDLVIRDGSGLSPQNRATTGALVRVLEYLATSPYWEIFWETLPEAGVPRELGRMRHSPAEGNLRAKTGTLKRVSALSGMVKTRSGERILFSILANDVPSTLRAKRAEDLLGIRLASLDRTP